MFVSTMTDEELKKQAFEDSIEIEKHYVPLHSKNLGKVIRQYNNFPRIFKSTYTTKNKNKYHFRIRVDSRADIYRLRLMNYYSIMDTDKGKYAIVAQRMIGEKRSLQIYAPHLFSRYTERFGVKMYEEERIHKFMEDSLDFKYSVGKEYEDGKIMCPVEGGIILGDVKGDIIIHKTFVNEKRLYEEQSELNEYAKNHAAAKTEAIRMIMEKGSRILQKYKV